MMHCILCKSKKIKNTQKINTKSIIDLYKIELNIDVTSEFLGTPFIDSWQCQNCKLLFFEPKTPGSEQFYKNLQQLESVYYSDSRPEFFEALHFINKKDSVLEIGAGSANFAEKLDCYSYVGLEYSQEAIEKAKNKGIKLMKKSIEDFSIHNTEKFDVVCSFHVLEHVSNPLTYIESCLKTLKKGGKLICAVPCSDSFYSSNHNHVLNMPPHHMTRWNTKTFQYLSETFDLEIEKLYVTDKGKPVDYFEIKIRTLFFKWILPNKQIVLNSLFLKAFHKIFKKINRALGLYKLDTFEKYKGMNMMLVAIKK